MQREFLLFSDCLLWLAPVESSAHSWDLDWSWSGSGSGSGSGGIDHSARNSPAATTESKASTTTEAVPSMIRTRSKSEAELSSLGSADSPPVTPLKSDRRRSHYHVGPPPPPPNMVKRHGSNDDKLHTQTQVRTT